MLSKPQTTPGPHLRTCSLSKPLLQKHCLKLDMGEAGRYSKLSWQVLAVNMRLVLKKPVHPPVCMEIWKVPRSIIKAKLWLEKVSKDSLPKIGRDIRVYVFYQPARKHLNYFKKITKKFITSGQVCKMLNPGNEFIHFYKFGILWVIKGVLWLARVPDRQPWINKMIHGYSLHRFEEIFEMFICGREVRKSKWEWEK